MQDGHTTYSHAITFFLAFLLLGFAVYIHFLTGFTGDKEWELLVARMWLEGKKLYVDHVPVSPPLIFYLYALPVYASLHLSFLEDYQWLVLLGMIFCVLSIVLSTRLITLHPAFSNNKRQYQFIALLVFLFIFRVMPAHFFDREHIFFAAILPYLLRWLPSLRAAMLPLWLRIVIGCLAGIGFCIKPHCLIVFAGIQAAYVWRERSLAILWGVENRVIYAVIALYLWIIWQFTPEYMSLALPMAWVTYSAINGGRAGIYNSTVLFTLILTFAMFRFRHTSVYRKDIVYLMALFLPFWGYALINNGWAYTYNPLISLILFTTAFILWEFAALKKEYAARKLPVWQLRIGSAACVLNFSAKALIALLYLALTFKTVVVNHGCNSAVRCGTYYDKIIAEINGPGRPKSFGTISMDYEVWAGMAKRSGAEWKTRFSLLWMLPKFLVSDADFVRAHQWILHYAGNALADDLDYNKPDIVFVDIPDTFYTIVGTINLIHYFSMFPHFEKAWRHYAYVHTIDNCDRISLMDEVTAAMASTAHKRINCRYEVYRRTP